MVVTRVGGLPELVKDGRAVCEPNSSTALAEAIKRILLDQQLYSKLQKHASALKNEFSWSTAIAATLMIYRQLIDTKNHRDS